MTMTQFCANIFVSSLQPNGSPSGITGLSALNGRVLALMRKYPSS